MISPPLTSSADTGVNVVEPRLKNSPESTWLGTKGAPAPLAVSVLDRRMFRYVLFPCVVISNEACADNPPPDAEKRTVASARGAKTANVKTAITPAKQRDIPRIPPSAQPH